MFNLITVIMALVLMIGAAIGGLYFLGESTEDAQLRAQLAQYYNYGTQIDAALLLYSVEQGGLPPGTGPQQVAELTMAGYLAETPQGGWFVRNLASMPAAGGAPATTSNASYRPLASTAICRQLNRVNGSDVSSTAIAAMGGCPPCEDPAYRGYPACIDNGTAVAGTGTTTTTSSSGTSSSSGSSSCGTGTGNSC